MLSNYVNEIYVIYFLFSITLPPKYVIVIFIIDTQKIEETVECFFLLLFLNCKFI